MTPVAFVSSLALRLVPMQMDDLDAVLTIEQQAFTMPWSRAMFVSELTTTRNAHLLLARVGEGEGEAAGYLGYRVVLDEMHIVIVAVHPNWRRRGIARAMLLEAMEQARQSACTRATLEVRVSNTAAQQLYYQLGFAPVGTRPRYYRRPTEDALILWRDPL